MKINEFPNYNSPKEDDILLIWDAQTSTTKHIKLADLKSIFGSGSGGASPPSPSNEITLTYASDGDTNGVFYYVGTNRLTQLWNNPHSTGLIEAKQSSAFSSNFQNPHFLVDRQPNELLCTASQSNGWFSVDLKSNKRLILSAYTIRCRSFNANHPRSWNFQGSNDSNNWLDIDIQSGRNLSANQYFTQVIPFTPPTYQHFRIIFTSTSSSGDNVLCLGEMELYGKLTWN